MNDDARQPRSILRARAVALAASRERAAPAGPTLDLLEFRLAHEGYAVETRYVEAVVPLKELTPLPCTPPFVLGIVNVRGRIVPVIDVRRFFDLPQHGLMDLHRIILMRGDDLEFGVLADSVSGLRTAPIADLQTSLPMLAGMHGDCLKGVLRGGVMVLDMARMLADPRMIVNDIVEE